MNRLFEVPFNHDPDFLNFLIKNNWILTKYIKHLFIAPYKDDYKSTRHQEAFKAEYREQYEEQLTLLRNAGYELSILFNMPDSVDDELINYYVNNIKATSFIIHNDELAKKLKLKGVTTIASITKRLQLKNIEQEDLSMYDYIVLDYTFNASYNRIEQLPKKYKYVLMVNTYCDYTCDFFTHWREKPLVKCPKDLNGFKNTTYIHPQHLEKFDKHISFYKIQGREYPTRIIQCDIMAYIFQKEKYFDTRVPADDPNYYYRYKGE